MRLFTYRRAGVVVVDGDRVLLMSMRPPGEGRWWHFPGGGIEDGESPAEAAARELYEETGLRATRLQELLRAGVQGGHHHYFLATCDDLHLGAVTGPEVDYAAGQDFRAEWVSIVDLPTLPVWPRCVAERVATLRTQPVTTDVPWVEDDRNSWDGVAGQQAPARLRVTVRAVVVDEHDRVAAIEREVAGERFFTLPGGGVDAGERVEDAVVREVAEELGLEVTPTRKLAVVVFHRAEQVSLQTYLGCEIAGGAFGTGRGDEFSEARTAARGSYRPAWLDTAALPDALRPAWLVDRLPQWIADPPKRPERFNEHHD